MVLEELDGFVDHIDGDKAYLTLIDKTGKEFLGEYSSEKLINLGIFERRKFKVQVVETDGVCKVELSPLPIKKLTVEQFYQITKELELLLTDDDLKDTY